MWNPLHLHSHYSLLDGLSKPAQIAKRCWQEGFTSCALTDHGSVSGAVAFMSAIQDTCQNCGNQKGDHKEGICPGLTTTFTKASIKPILGCELYISQDASVKSAESRKLNHLVVLAKNLAGWRSLMSAVSRSNDNDVYYYKPRLDMEMLKGYAQGGNLIAFSGHPGSCLARILFDEFGNIRPDAKEAAAQLALQYQDIFGKGNFFIEIQRIDIQNYLKAVIIADILREVSVMTGIPCVATADSHYPTQQDAVDQRVLLCSAMKTTFKNINKAFQESDNVPLRGFFTSTNYHIPTAAEIAALNTEAEIEATQQIADMCENYNILSSPKLPHFPCPGGMSENAYLKHLCAKGWKDILEKYNVINDSNRQTYQDRIRMELKVFEEAGLEGYFLIVQDYMNWAKQQGWLTGPGRGSGAGCLASYLLGITLIDPIPHDLLFSRFYNAGRNTKDRVSFPDIDCDFPITKREQVIGYMAEKHGKTRVAQMCTFGRLQGRGAAKEVLRVHDACGYAMMNTITRSIPHEHEIADKMEESGESSILMWTLKNEPELISDFCRLNDDGTFSGEYATYFEQAIRLEGTFKSQGKHAAGVIIAADDLDNVCPMIRAAHGEEKVAGMEMNDLEAMGHTKFDILGVAALDKLMGVNSLLEKGIID